MPHASLTANAKVREFVERISDLVTPDCVVWIDGSETQLEALRREALKTGEIIKLNEEKLPGCYYHRSALNDVARVEGRTYICSKNSEDCGPTNNWMEPEKAYAMAQDILKGAMRGRTMYVIPFSMGPVGSPFSKAGIEITDSIYVVISMAIMTRIGDKVLDALGDSDDFVRGVHGKCELDEDRRYILHFPEDNAIWSVNSGYGGNVLLGKKCFALRIASYQGQKEGWMAEHMLILGIENPQGEVKYVAAAFPSACGKTNLAMLVPPKEYADKGYKVWTLGDDIAWIRVGEDGRMYAINPEAGFFGVAPGTNAETNFNALAATSKGTIFTNVVYNPNDGTVWWEKLDKNPPKNALDWKGNPWDPASGEKGAHPNSRFTAPAKNCPCIAPNWEDPQGVPISAMIFGGRRARTAPLVYQSRDWDHGVFVGSIMASETTAAATGAVGVVRIDPMAMRPFIGYHAGDYFRHWIDMGKKAENPPKIFNVNWFRTDDDGNFIWPGYGDNFRVLEWILRRCDGEIDAQETAIGYIPNPGDINIGDIDYEYAKGRKFGRADLENILSIDKDIWLADMPAIDEFYATIGDKLPCELKDSLATLKSKLTN